MERPQIPIPPPPDVTRKKASSLAHGQSNGGQPDNFYTYRLARGFPFRRAGRSVVSSSTFATLRGTSGSAVGLHQPVNQAALTNGLLDPSKPGFLQLGSNVPTFVTIPFTFNATSATALTISWPATALRRANRSITNSSDTAIVAGSISITGLTASTKYFFYPFFAEASKLVGWAGAGNATSAGSPAIAQTIQSDVVVQAQGYQGFVPLGVLTFTQPASGSSSQTGGYGSGNNGITGGGRGYPIY